MLNDPAIIVALIAAVVSVLGFLQSRGKLSAETAQTYQEIAEKASLDVLAEKEKRRELEQKLEDLFIRINGLQSQLNDLRAENEVLRARVLFLEGEVTRLEEENKSLRARVGTGPLGS